MATPTMSSSLSLSFWICLLSLVLVFLGLLIRFDGGFLLIGFVGVFVKFFGLWICCWNYLSVCEFVVKFVFL